jgi:restriction system protein
MAIPDYQSLMLPILSALDDDLDHSAQELRDRLAGRFRLTEAELSSRQLVTLLHKRVSWAKSSLKNAWLLDDLSREIMHITPLGLEVVRTQPGRIDNDYLAQFPGFFVFNKGRPSYPPEEAGADIEMTPSELLEKNYRILQDQHAHDLLEQVQAAPPAFFERLVVDLLLAMGYGGSREDAGEAIGASNDGGIDGFIREDRLGLDVIYIQAKRWRNPVGRPAIQGFVGSLVGRRARKGIFITTSVFTKQASDYAQSLENRVILIDGIQLTQLMIEHGVGVADIETYTLKRIDTDYFTTE